MVLNFSALTSLFLIMFFSLPVGTGDTTELIKGSNYLFSCLAAPNSGQCEGLERFGFTPHLISALLFTVYPNSDVVIVLWSILNFVAFLIIIYFFYNYFYFKYKVTKDSRLFFIGLAFSPIIAYGLYSFSEIVFILFGILFLHFLFEKKYYLSIIPGFLALTYKDNAFLTVIPLAIAVLLIKREVLTKYVNLIILIFFSVIINFAFNFLKYKSITNSVYQDLHTVINLKINISNFFAVWFSPSGGVLGYFFLLPFLIFLIFFIKFRTFSRELKIIAFLIIVPILLLTLNLTFWFSPFGWASWGPRLILPTLILVSFTAFVFIKEYALEFSERWKPISHVLFFSSSYLMFLSALGFIFNPGIWNTWLENLYKKGIACDYLPLWEESRDEYWACNLPLTWTYNSLPANSVLEVLKVLREFTFSNPGSLLMILLIFIITFYFIFNLKQNLKKSTKFDFSSN